MRVLLTSFAMETHFSGSVPLAWALRTAGHQVRVASQPALTGSIIGAGLTAVPVGTDHSHDVVLRTAGAEILALHQNRDYLEKRHDKLGFDFLKGHDTVMSALFYSQINNEPMINDLVDFARNWQPDLVIWEPFTFAGAVAARASGAAHARLLSFPDMFLSTRQLFLARMGRDAVENHDDSLGEWLTWTLDRFGCEFDEEAVTGQWSIDQMPASVRIPLGQPTVPMRYIPYNGVVPMVVPDWLRVRPERPRVCMTLGMTVRKTPFPNAVAVDEVFEAVDGLDVDIVAALDASERELVTAAPANVRMVEHVPLDVLLPTCSAIVHHGGAGTWSTAAALGVPQVALGWMWDAVYRAQRLEQIGAGLYLPSEELTAAGLRGRLVRVLEEPAFQQRADALRDEIAATPSPNDVVPTLEKLTIEHQPLTSI